MPPVNQLLKIIRKNKGYLSKELAKTLSTSKETLKDWETRDNPIRLPRFTLEKWLRFLDFSQIEMVATVQLYKRQAANPHSTLLGKAVSDLLFFNEYIPEQKLEEIITSIQIATLPYIASPARQITEASFQYHDASRFRSEQ